MERFVTNFGAFEFDDEVVIIATRLGGEQYVLEGLVKGKRTSLGVDYLLIEKDDLNYDIALRSGYVDYIINRGKGTIEPPEPEEAKQEPETRRYSRVIR